MTAAYIYIGTEDYLTAMQDESTTPEPLYSTEFYDDCAVMELGIERYNVKRGQLELYTSLGAFFQRGEGERRKRSPNSIDFFPQTSIVLCNFQMNH